MLRKVLAKRFQRLLNNTQSFFQYRRRNRQRHQYADAVAVEATRKQDQPFLAGFGTERTGERCIGFSFVIKQLKRGHGAELAAVGDGGEALFPYRETLRQHFAHLLAAGQDVLFFDGFDHCKGRCTGKRVAAVGAA